MDGDFEDNSTNIEPGRLVCSNRPKGCMFSYFCKTKPLMFPSFCHRVKILPIESALLLSVKSPKSLHKMYDTGSKLLTNKRDYHLPIHRQLVISGKQSEHSCEECGTLQIMLDLRFKVNLEKNNLIPCQIIQCCPQFDYSESLFTKRKNKHNNTCRECLVL